MGIDLSAITNIKLKKVGVPADDRPKPTETDKIYSEEGGVKSAFEKFKQKGKKITVKIHKINDALLNFVNVKLLKLCIVKVPFIFLFGLFLTCSVVEFLKGLFLLLFHI